MHDGAGLSAYRDALRTAITASAAVIWSSIE
jgi:hypothetical protein